MKNSLSLIAVMWIILQTSNAAAKCRYIKPEIQDIVVKDCSVIIPADDPALVKEVNRVFKGEQAKRYMEAYRGVIITTPDDKKFFYRPTEDLSKCVERNAKMKVEITYACCDGAPDVPCWLGVQTSGKISKVK